MTNTSAAGAISAQQNARDGFTHRQILTILSGLMLGMFLAALDQTVVSTAMRTISDDLKGFDLQAWATTAFLITATISTPLYGKLSDLYGRRPFYLGAISIFVIGSMLCGMAQSMYELAAFRALQGIGAGGLMSLALAIIGDIVPPRERARYQSMFLAVFGTSSVAGPLIGGFFAGADSIFGVAGWRWIFYINVPVGAAALIVVSRVLHIPHTRREHRIDWPGALALVLCLVPLLIIAEQGRTWGWASGRAMVCYALGIVGLALFILAERWYRDDALLPLRLFRNRSFAITSSSSFITGSGMFGSIVLLPLYLQVVKGSSPTVAGLQTLPLVLGILSGAMGSGVVISRTSRYKMFPVVGSAMMAAGLVLFSFVGADTPLWRTMIVMAFFGIGLGFNMQPIILAAQNAVDPSEMGVATSSVTFFRQMGGTAGAAAFLSILFSTAVANIGDAYRSAATGDPAFQQAAQVHPDQIATLQSGSSGSLSDTSFLKGLDPALTHPFKVGFSNSIDLIFLFAAGIILIAVVVVSLLPELPLRQMSGVQARQQQADDAALALAAAGVEAEPEPVSDVAGSATQAGPPRDFRADP
ncbi:MAG: MDR family MFS transporter [Nocardioidaceae bacterium]